MSGDPARGMRWWLLGPMLTAPDSQWLQPFARREGRDFAVVPWQSSPPRGAVTAGSDWIEYARHAHRAMQSARSLDGRRSGFVALFPQAAMVLGLEKRLRRAEHPIVAWYFNVGALYGGIKAQAARAGAAAIDAFIVHSRAEIEAYSDWLGLPPERFHFVPLQRPVEPVRFSEDEEEPFIVSLGSARRDYALLARVAAKLRVRTVIVAEPHAVEGIAMPDNVEVRRGLSFDQCNELQQRARLVVVPVLNNDTASGQVALLTAMMYGRPTVATRCIGTVDYAEHGQDTWLVPAGDASALEEAIASLWEDGAARRRLGQQARARVSDTLSDERTGARLDEILRRFEG